MFRLFACLALVCAVLQAEVLASPVQAAHPTSSAPVNAVIEWNRTLLVIVRTSGAQPATIHSTRSFAMLHAAIYDAVNNIRGNFTPYLVRLSDVPANASREAAAHQAAHDVLLALYPSFQATLDAELQQDLALLPTGDGKINGVAVGQQVAVALLAFRANDGSGVAPPPFIPQNVAGFYQLTPPDFTPADFTHWGAVTPFAIARAEQFRPEPPPPLDSDEYAASYNSVKTLGKIDSTQRTAEQTLIGNFWNGKIQNYWNEIAQTAALGHNLDLEQTARLFALLNMSLADSTISFFDAKYFYHLWRPVTAIENGQTDHNLHTEPDPAWLPLTTKTAPDPSYPGAHSAISRAGAEVLRFVFGDTFDFDVTSETLPGVTRHFTSFTAAAQEAGFSRIYAGQHFPFDHIAGKKLGRAVAQDVDQTILLPQ